jgi:hypothetical protein
MTESELPEEAYDCIFNSSHEGSPVQLDPPPIQRALLSRAERERAHLEIRAQRRSNKMKRQPPPVQNRVSTNANAAVRDAKVGRRQSVPISSRTIPVRSAVSAGVESAGTNDNPPNYGLLEPRNAVV